MSCICACLSSDTRFRSSSTSSSSSSSSSSTSTSSNMSSFVCATNFNSLIFFPFKLLLFAYQLAASASLKLLLVRRRNARVSGLKKLIKSSRLVILAASFPSLYLAWLIIELTLVLFIPIHPSLSARFSFTRRIKCTHTHTQTLSSSSKRKKSHLPEHITSRSH